MIAVVKRVIMRRIKYLDNNDCHGDGDSGNDDDDDDR